jgi:membrane fusion protein (multidrug efflux system)
VIDATDAGANTERGERANKTRPNRQRRTIVASVCVLTLMLTGGGVTAAFALGSNDRAAAKKVVNTGVATVDKGTLHGTTNASGTLEYSDPREVTASLGGVLTWLPAAGAQINLGQSLFAVDNQQVYLFYGQLPAWRTFESGMDAGPDVQQLEESLKQLGYFTGTPNQDFDWSTKAAIRAWQKATGQEQTGSIDLGRIVFQGGAVRVSELKSAVGNNTSPGAPVISISSLTKQVSVGLALADQQLAAVGTKVQIQLPGGTSTNGTVISVGVPTEQDNGQGGKTAVIPVVVVLDDPAAAANLQQASVTVQFPSAKRENVLSVPVAALLALPGGKFGVEVIKPNGTTTRVPVRTGLFAGGRVEISGDGIKAGDEVTVPEL